MNGMCVLQEAKLAALVSKRWEHQLEEHSVQESLGGLKARSISAVWAQGESFVYAEGNSLAQFREPQYLLVTLCIGP